jgi:hypothetical protein
MGYNGKCSKVLGGFTRPILRLQTYIKKSKDGFPLQKCFIQPTLPAPVKIIYGRVAANAAGNKLFRAYV